MIVLLSLICILGLPAEVHSVFYIYPRTDNALLEQAQNLGEAAKVNYFKSVIGMHDASERRTKYLDGLERCNNIGTDQTLRMEHRARTESRYEDAKLLEKMGLKEFTAKFMTVPVAFMYEIAHMACSKHEQQLQCGSVFEGDEITRNRIADLKTIGNHKMMFEKECVNPSYVPETYPCIGSNVAQWSRSCRMLMEDYYTTREAVNAKISSIYETSLNTVKKLKTRQRSAMKEFVFHNAMRMIAKLEGEKCGKFKMMRSCVLPALERQCGHESMMALHTSISLGYLRTERRERLQLDFDTFGYPQDPRCEGL
uniref:Venom protein n=1 Tax=Steinernema glaseri TaxID=37863 RepID=A0A1I7YTJ8_9BILA